MAILQPTPINSIRFHWLSQSRLLMAEASDFGRAFTFGRVYDDACDVGLTVISHRTGRAVVFAVDHVERDGEGDTLYWDLVPADLRERNALNVTVRIYND